MAGSGCVPYELQIVVVCHKLINYASLSMNFTPLDMAHMLSHRGHVDSHAFSTFLFRFYFGIATLPTATIISLFRRRVVLCVGSLSRSSSVTG